MNHARAHHVEKSRVGRLTKGYKSGGAVKEIGKKSLALHRQEHKDLHAEGDGPKHRMDRTKRKRGGRVHREDGGGTHVPGDTLETKNGRAMNKYGERASVPVKSIPNGPSRADFIATRARGGKVKGKHNAKTIVNVITGHPGGGAAPPPMAPPGLAGAMAPPPVAPPPMGVKPPMAGPA